jgi:hypothetical protein
VASRRVVTRGSHRREGRAGPPVCCAAVLLACCGVALRMVFSLSRPKRMPHSRRPSVRCYVPMWGVLSAQPWYGKSPELLNGNKPSYADASCPVGLDT